MNMAIIPARGGSKRIPRKNIRSFNGKPMIAWSIDAAKKSGLFQHIVVSTDDEEIAKIAMSYGAEVPFLRPEELANDISPTVPVISHAINACAQLGWTSDYICCIYPCAPFITRSHLLSSFEMLKNTDADYVYPVAEYPHPVQRAMLRNQDGHMSFVTPEYEMSRTQDLIKTFHDTGQFYWGKSNAWSSQKKMHSEGLGFVVPHWQSVDIDTLDDWRRAELIYNAMHNI